jgi:hypothetical protein
MRTRQTVDGQPFTAHSTFHRRELGNMCSLLSDAHTFADLRRDVARRLRTRTLHFEIVMRLCDSP